TVITPKDSHTEQKKKLYTNLVDSQEVATKTSSYSSEKSRKAFIDTCLHRCNNQPPYSWQLDAAKAFYLGLDCTVLAGTGSRKSLPFVMPCMLSSNKACWCHKMGLMSVAVNHQMYTDELHEVQI
ncbi:hypothetical protein PAXRUDRAFT_155267, partial [Paxillus rubicundulus Ve08.2h10]